MTVAGADRVIAVDAIPERLELARAFGADDALNLANLTTPEARVQAVMVVSHVFPLERIGEGFRQADWMNRQGGTAHVSRAAVGTG